MRRIVEALVQSFLRRAGRSGTIDPDLNTWDLVAIGTTRAIPLLRGLIRLGSVAFCGTRVKMRRGRRIKVQKYVSIGDYTVLDGISRQGITLLRGSKLGRYVTVTGTSTPARMGVGLFVGRNSAIGDFGHIGCAGGVKLGDDVIIGPYVTFHSQEHNSSSTNEPIRTQGTTEAAIEIEDDVWVGARVTFLAGAHVGAHSVVAAGAVVRGSFPAYSIIGGVPARELKSRMASAEATAL